MMQDDGTQQKPIVLVKDLVLAYGGHEILHDVQLRILPQESWFVIGPNGAGKTTLIKAILGLLQPRSGRLTLATELTDRRRLGFVPQRLELPTTVPTTVREFVSLGFTGLGLKKAERSKRLAAALTQVGLFDHVCDSMAILSGGQRQRASIARALVREPILLIVDEPMTGLDLVAERDLMQLIGSLGRERGLTILFVGHDLPLVAAHATHVAIVAGGTVQSGSAEEMLTSESLSQTYGIPITVSRINGRPTIQEGGTFHV